MNNPDATGPVAVLSLNPAVDMTYEIDRLIANEKVHARSVRYDPGGNGINVGRALKRLNLQAATFCVIAGEIGGFLRGMLADDLDEPRFFEVPGETRINGTVLSRGLDAQYEVSGLGPEIDGSTLERLVEAFVEYVADGCAVLTGSLQPSIPDGIYADITRRIHKQGGRVVVDAHDALLRKAVAAQPFLIKPNRFELEQLVGQSLPRIEDVVNQARQLQQSGVAYVCVSMGEDGAVLVSDSEALYARPPEVIVNSSVGAGDSMVAGLAGALLRHRGTEQALREAVACSVGTVLQPGTELFSPSDLEWLVQKVHLEPV